MVDRGPPGTGSGRLRPQFSSGEGGTGTSGAGSFVGQISEHHPSPTESRLAWHVVGGQPAGKVCFATSEMRRAVRAVCCLLGEKADLGEVTQGQQGQAEESPNG